MLGPRTEVFETEFAAYTGTRHAVSVSTGTSALEIILRAKDVRGRSVAVPTNTNFATVAAVLHAGGKPVFLDMVPDTFMPTTEIPAGRIEPGRSPEHCATAELREETGYSHESIERIGMLHIGNGFARCEAHIFLARGAAIAAKASPEPGDTILEIEPVEIGEAVTRLTAPGQDGESALALLLAVRSLRGRSL